MKFIGITGGVGAGKSQVLKYLKEKDGVKVMLADEIAHELMKPGTVCYNKIIEKTKGIDLLHDKSKEFSGEKLSKFMFSDNANLKLINDIVHPAVKSYVKSIYEKEFLFGKTKILVLEAALLIEENYNEICDELWYIYTSEENRYKRLKENRGYSDERIKGIMRNQLSEKEFIENTDAMIDNNGSIEDTHMQIDRLLTRL